MGVSTQTKYASYSPRSHHPAAMSSAMMTMRASPAAKSRIGFTLLTSAAPGKGSGTFQLVQQRRQLVGEHIVVVPVATSKRALLEPMAQLLDGRFLGFPLTLQPVARAMVAVDFVQLAV